MPSVTLGLPTFNSESYLDACIESITKQTFSDFRVLVVDGGSSDTTLERIKDWRSRDVRVDIHPEPVVGLYQAFNTILAETTTRYVCIHPADDIVSPGFLKTMSSALDSHGEVAAAVCPLRVFDDQGVQVESPYTRSEYPIAESEPRPDIRVHRWPFDGLTGLLRQNPFISLTQLLFRVRDIKGFRFRTDLGSTADVLFNLRLALGSDVVHVDSTWGGWRVHPHQASQRDSEESVKRQNLEKMLDIAIDEHLRDIVDPEYRSRFQSLVDVMATFQGLAERVSGRSHLSRWGTVLRTAARVPRAAQLYAMSRTLNRDAARDWLRKQASSLTEYRLENRMDRAESSRH